MTFEGEFPGRKELSKLQLRSLREDLASRKADLVAVEACQKSVRGMKVAGKFVYAKVLVGPSIIYLKYDEYLAEWVKCSDDSLSETMGGL